MKKVKLYLPFEIDFINSDMHSELIERYGAHGLGIYFMVLMELRNHEGYRCSLSSIKGAARRCLADPEILVSVLCDFELFEFRECGGRIMISSVYIDRVMQPFDEKTRNFSSTASENTVTVERPVYGMSTVTHREIINIIKTKTTTTNTKAATAAKVVDAAVANVANDVVVVNDTKPEAGCATLCKCTSAHTHTATPVPYGNGVAMPHPEGPCKEYPQKAFPANNGWRHCSASCGKALPPPSQWCRGETGLGDRYRRERQMQPASRSNATFIRSG